MQECVKEAILASRKMKAPVLHVRAGGVPAPPAHRQSPAQVRFRLAKCTRCSRLCGTRTSPIL